ncbi:MAG: CRISPR-associated endonuclease Cas2 [Deltaproteobacteria bacterium]|nr:CRISPR-associated endonuclease Cas2 [Deltaproteobacteria bacterium]
MLTTPGLLESVLTPPCHLPALRRGQRYLLVVYDVEEDRRRQQMGDACLRHGLRRVQQSVYCGPVFAGRADSLRAALATLAHDEEEVSSDPPRDPPERVAAPRARLLFLYLDGGSSWWGLHVPSPRTPLTPLAFALRPRTAADYIFF